MTMASDVRRAEREERIRRIADQIPAGQVMTYGEIAAIAGLHPRTVGQVVSRISEDIPWWRIVAADGMLPACHRGSAGQKLAEEQVPLRCGKVDFTALMRRDGD